MCDVTADFHQTLTDLKRDLDLKKLPINKRATKHIKTTAILKNLIIKIKDVVSAITNMKHFLLKNRKDYLNLYSVLDSVDYLSDDDRDRIDNTVETFIKNYTNIISQLKLESCTNTNLTEQMKQHCQHVICLVEDYHKHITSIYTEQKQIRVKRALDKCKVSKLEAFCKTDKDQQLLANGELRRRVRRKNSLNDDLEDEEEYQSDETNFVVDQNLQQRYEEEERILETLTQEEQQMFQEENDQLFDELNALTNEVKKIEGQVVEIAQLQELFT